MTLRRLIILCAGLFAFTDAFIEFDKSRLYDEKDFEGHATIHLYDYCEIGCQIYVSLAIDANETAKHVFIEDPIGRKTSLLKANTQEKSGRMNPYIVEKGNSQMRFLNENVGAKSAPVAVWVLRDDAENIDAAQVFDGYGSDPGDVKTGGIITYIGVEPFRFHTGVWGAFSSFEAITAGFDAFSSADDCTRVIKENQQKATHNIKADNIRSPLFSIIFELEPKTSIRISSGKLPRKGELTRELYNRYERHFEFDLLKPNYYRDPLKVQIQPSYASSTGYIGCAVKEAEHRWPYRTSTFRSTLYEKEATYHFSTYDTNTTQFTIHSDIAVSKSHPVEIVADGQSFRLFGNNEKTTRRLAAQNMTITWNRNDNYTDEHFMIRVTHGAANGIPMLFSVILLVFMCY